VVARRSRHNPSESAWFGPNLGPTHRARRHAETFSGRLHRSRTLSHGRVTRSADLGVKGSRVQSRQPDRHAQPHRASQVPFSSSKDSSVSGVGRCGVARSNPAERPVRSADVGPCELGDTPYPATATAPAIEQCGIVGRNQIGPTVVIAAASYSPLVIAEVRLSTGTASWVRILSNVGRWTCHFIGNAGRHPVVRTASTIADVE
jgi:hypothetical protein